LLSRVVSRVTVTSSNVPDWML